MPRLRHAPYVTDDNHFERSGDTMPFSIALAGKGGTGKTTIAGLLVKYLVHSGKKPVLAVDADANANLNEVLGVEVTDSLGQAREEMKKGQVPSGMTKDVFMSMRLEQAIVEADGFDLVVMGQPEGAGCYCAANTLLTGFLERLTGNYPYIVMDNEAGMEHISRLTTKNVDVLLLVSDASRRSLEAAIRIAKLAENLRIGVGQRYLVVNQAKDGLPQAALDMIEKEKIPLAGMIPDDESIYQYDFDGTPTIQLEADNPALKAAYGIFDKIVP